MQLLKAIDELNWLQYQQVKLIRPDYEKPISDLPNLFLASAPTIDACEVNPTSAPERQNLQFFIELRFSHSQLVVTIASVRSRFLRKMDLAFKADKGSIILCLQAPNRYREIWFKKNY